MKPKIKQIVKIDDAASNKRVIFGDDLQEIEAPVVKHKFVKPVETEEAVEETGEISGNKKQKKGFKKQYDNADDVGTKWYQFYEEHNTNEFKDIKDSELNTLQQICRSCFNDETQKLTKSKFHNS